MTQIEQLQKDIHDNAVRKWFWEEQRCVTILYVLTNTEKPIES